MTNEHIERTIPETTKSPRTETTKELGGTAVGSERVTAMQYGFDNLLSGHPNHTESLDAKRKAIAEIAEQNPDLDIVYIDGSIAEGEKREELAKQAQGLSIAKSATYAESDEDMVNARHRGESAYREVMAGGAYIEINPGLAAEEIKNNAITAFNQAGQ